MSNNDQTNLNGDNHTPAELAAAQLTAYALGQLPSEELVAFERSRGADQVSETERETRDIENIANAVANLRSLECLPPRSPELRAHIAKALETPAASKPTVEINHRTGKPSWRPSVVEGLVIGGMLAVLAALLLPPVQSAREAARRVQSSSQQWDGADDPALSIQTHRIKESADIASLLNEQAAAAAEQERLNDMLPVIQQGRLMRDVNDLASAQAQAANDAEVQVAEAAIQVARTELAQSEEIRRKNPNAISLSQLRKDQFNNEKALAQRKQVIDEKKIADLTAKAEQAQREAKAVADEKEAFIKFNQQLMQTNKRLLDQAEKGLNSEQYAPIYENQFLSPLNHPLSTFSIDVDTASYANTRRFLTSNRLPPRNAVRIEELVNYFRYDYPQPKDDQSFSVNMEVAECPWREGHLVLRVGLKGKDIERAKRPTSNLVFLLDVSGSMADENKLPLLKTAMKMLVSELGENDRVSIVTYAGNAGLKLPSARGHEQKQINAAIDSLAAGGSTNGSAGIELAYEQATAHFIKDGANRVILCTDGDLNVGITSDEALVKLIKDKAKSGVFLTVLGFGEGNLKDAKMERLADNGNGLYAYIDSVREAKKVLVEQLTGSTITIAKDVKVQIEFNPAQISAYRLLGYENRVLAAQDFNNDKKDAGEIGAGHTVTALYELVPVGAIEKQEPQQQPAVDALKYQQPGANLLPEKREPGANAGSPGPGLVPAKDSSGELLTLKLRYKEPDADTSQLLEFPLQDRGGSFNSASPDFQFASAVASFGMILRQSQFRGTSNLAAVEEIGSGTLGTDAGGYRAEFIDLVRKAQTLGAR